MLGEILQGVAGYSAAGWWFIPQSQLSCGGVRLQDKEVLLRTAHVVAKPPVVE